MAWRDIEIDLLISMQSLIHTEFARALVDDQARGLGERVRADHPMDTPIAEQAPLWAAAVRWAYRVVRRLRTGS
jgi:hypothetical protein